MAERHLQVSCEKNSLDERKANVVPFRVLRRQTTESELLLVGFQVEGLCRLGKIGEEEVAENRDGNGDYSVDDE